MLEIQASPARCLLCMETNFDGIFKINVNGLLINLLS